MPYREERSALEQRLVALEKELADVRARASELADLKKIEHRLAAEAAAVRRTLSDLDAQTSAPRRLPLLDDLKIASPCSARWEEMIGDDRVRFCEHCAKDVYNVSAMTRADAEALLAEKAGGSLCVRLYQRKDGTVLTSDCPVGVRKKRVKRVAALAIAGGGIAAAMSSLVTTRMGAPRPIDAVSVATGDVAPTPPPSPPPTATVAPSESPRPMTGVVAPPKPPPEKAIMGKVRAP